jgi:hypothetical protein
VRHATEGDLVHVEALLVELRTVPELRERKPGYFSRGARAFLHFHADDFGQLYVDARLNGAFQRFRITSQEEQTDFLVLVRQELDQPAESAG